MRHAQPSTARAQLPPWLPARIDDGGRHRMLIKLAGFLRRQRMESAEIGNVLSMIDRERCKPPVETTDPGDVRTIADGAGAWAPGPGRTQEEIAAVRRTIARLGHLPALRPNEEAMLQVFIHHADRLGSMVVGLDLRTWGFEAGFASLGHAWRLKERLEKANRVRLVAAGDAPAGKAAVYELVVPDDQPDAVAEAAVASNAGERIGQGGNNARSEATEVALIVPTLAEYGHDAFRGVVRHGTGIRPSRGLGKGPAEAYALLVVCATWPSAAALARALHRPDRTVRRWLQALVSVRLAARDGRMVLCGPASLEEAARTLGTSGARFVQRRHIRRQRAQHQAAVDLLASRRASSWTEATRLVRPGIGSGRAPSAPTGRVAGAPPDPVWEEGLLRERPQPTTAASDNLGQGTRAAPQPRATGPAYSVGECAHRRSRA